MGEHGLVCTGSQDGGSEDEANVLVAGGQHAPAATATLLPPSASAAPPQLRRPLQQPSPLGLLAATTAKHGLTQARAHMRCIATAGASKSTFSCASLMTRQPWTHPWRCLHACNACWKGL
jgi:hypothetical protein